MVGSRLIGSPAFAQDAPTFTPEAGATLRLLRWSPFVQGDEDAWLANTKHFTDATGVQVRVDKESWEDIRPKAAVAANVGSGPDLMLVWFDDAAPVSGQAARRHRSRRLSRQQVWRLV